jgi:hypothetical protein
MELNGSLQYSQESAIGPYPEPHESNPHPISTFMLTLSFHLRLGLVKRF